MTASSIFIPMRYPPYLFLYVAVFLVALGLKAHYSFAASEELTWILYPTTLLVELFSGSGFAFEAGEGYVRADKQFVIAPACAGVNFMITAFCMSAFHGIRKSGTTPAGVRYIALCLLLSYGLTLIVNTLRISISMELFSENVQWGWLTPERIHRLAGCILYFVSLSLFYAWLKRLGGERNKHPPGKGLKFHLPYWRMVGGLLTPFIWYSLVVIGIPLLNHGWRTSGFMFVEHCLTVFSMSLVVFLSFFLIKLMYSKKPDHEASHK